MLPLLIVKYPIIWKFFLWRNTNFINILDYMIMLSVKFYHFLLYKDIYDNLEKKSQFLF